MIKKVYASRYANYTANIYVGSNLITCSTDNHGSWWSSSKPYLVELPWEDL